MDFLIQQLHTIIMRDNNFFALKGVFFHCYFEIQQHNAIYTRHNTISRNQVHFTYCMQTCEYFCGREGFVALLIRFFRGSMTHQKKFRIDGLSKSPQKSSCVSKVYLSFYLFTCLSHQWVWMLIYWTYLLICLSTRQSRKKCSVSIKVHLIVNLSMYLAMCQSLSLSPSPSCFRDDWCSNNN